MFGLFKKNQPASDGVMVIARLNARVQPIDRGDYFEDPLDEALSAEKLGSVTGGGTQLADEPAGIAFCDVEILVSDANENTLSTIIKKLEVLGAPKGSKLMLPEGDDIPFGQFEGLGLFLNGSDLPAEVYAESDVNLVIEECGKLLGEAGDFRGYWEGSQETALYFYGPSFDAMQQAIKPFVAEYPLCQKARIEQIA